MTATPVSPGTTLTAAALDDATLAPKGSSRTSKRVRNIQDQIDRLRSRLRIAVIYGGDKDGDGAVINRTVNPRSWKSYKAVAEDIAGALERLGIGGVMLVPDDMNLGDFLRRENVNMAWLNTGGVQGYAPMAHGPSMLEMMGIPYVGHNPLLAATLDNKDAFKRNLMHFGIPTAPFVTWHMARGAFRPKVNRHFVRTFKDHWGGYVVKPVSGRASLHVHYVKDEADLPDIVAEVYDRTENHVLIEAYLPGREYCVAVGGPVAARGQILTRCSDPTIFATVERVLQSEEKIFTSMDVRPISMDRMRCLDPATDQEQIHCLEDLAREIFVEMHLESLVRIDLRADAAGKLCVLEANPKPDLKAPSDGTTSFVSAGLDRMGMTYDDLILSLLASRLDMLFMERRGTVTHLRSLME